MVAAGRRFRFSVALYRSLEEEPMTHRNDVVGAMFFEPDH